MFCVRLFSIGDLKMWRFISSLVLLAVSAGYVMGQLPPPSDRQVDKTEIQRWGDRVVKSGTGLQAGEEFLFTAAMAPPADDSDQWFVTMFSMNGCPGCDKLRKNFEGSELAAFVAPPTDANGKPIPGKRPWAFWNEYKHGDPFQKQRFEDFKIGQGPFPILVIQPPRNQRFGHPSWVVWRYEAADLGRMSAKTLAASITEKVNAYCKKLHDQGYIPPNVHASKAKTNNASHAESPAAGHDGTIPPADDSAIGQTVPNKPAAVPPESVIGGPWGPDPPAPTPFNPQYPQFPPSGPNVQPNVPQYPNNGGGLGFLSEPGMGTLYILALLILKGVELLAPVFGWNPGSVGLLRELLERFKPADETPKASKSKK